MDIVKYAKLRGVRVIIEFDTPGHCFPSWGKGGPEHLLTTCEGSTGPLRADRNETYEFLRTLFAEVAGQRLRRPTLYLDCNT